MNHRTHSGTVIVNPNAFDNKNCSKNMSSSATSMETSSKPTSRQTAVLDFDALESIPFDDDDSPKLISGKNNHSNQAYDYSSAIGERALNGNDAIGIEQMLTTMSMASPLTANKSKSSEFDGKATIDSGDASSLASTMHTNVSNHNNNAKISAVFKKLTTYFSSSSHKTLINLKPNHSKNSKNKQWDNHNTFTYNTATNNNNNKHKKNLSSIDTCAVFENCNVVSLPMSSKVDRVGNNASRTVTNNKHNKSHSTCSSSSTSECSINSSNSSSSINKSNCNCSSFYQKSDKCCTQMPQQLPKVRQMCGDKRDVDKCDEIDGDNQKIDKTMTTMTAAGMTSSSSSATPVTRTPNERQKDLNAVEPNGETFSLPRVSLKQRYVFDIRYIIFKGIRFSIRTKRALRPEYKNQRFRFLHW